MPSSIEILRDDLFKALDGYIIFEVIEIPAAFEHGTSIRGILDEFVEQFGFTGLGEYWHEINRRTAETYIQLLLYFGVGSSKPILPAFRACELATQSLALFDEKQNRYFTNAHFDSEGLSMFTGISDVLFDAGVICNNTHRLGILWAQEDEP